MLTRDLFTSITTFVWILILLTGLTDGDLTEYSWSFKVNTNYQAAHHRLPSEEIFLSLPHVYLKSQCAQKCLQNKRCLSFNFQQAAHICELGKSSHTTIALIKSIGYVYYSRNDIQVNSVSIILLYI